MIIHIISDAQKIQYFLLPNELNHWLDKLGRIPLNEEYIKELYSKEEENIDFETYSSFLNKAVKNALHTNDFSVISSIYLNLGFSDFDTIIQLIEFINSNEISIEMERYDVSEGL